MTRTGLRINRYCSMSDFPLFKMAAVRHLRFLKVGNFKFRSSSEAQYASSCQISRSGDMAYFRFSRWRPSAILNLQKLEFLTASTLLRAKMRHCAKFCEDRSNRSGDIADFEFSRWRPSAILDCQKLKILTSGPVWNPNMRHHTKFRENRSNRSRDMAGFRFSRWRLSAILDFQKLEFLTARTLLKL